LPTTPTIMVFALICGMYKNITKLTQCHFCVIFIG